MRPIVLDMNGFASFREPTRVDFTDADFFALVGPTGSGKSTVIDAMTFALYGSVPRWGRRGMVSLALAPTVARGTVKLVFEVEGQRYVVARELRRAGSQVNQRAARLERLTEPSSLAEPGDLTEVLAGELAGVTAGVERLLGLSFDDFCHCVVLPQGQFANFLHAKPSERQEILLRLLGAEHYKQMMTLANQHANAAAQRADTLTETLLDFADATPGAEAAARAAELALTELSQRVAAAQPQLTSAAAELTAAQDEAVRLDADRSALAAVRIPDGITAIDADLSADRAALGLAQAAEQAAEEADREARAALASGPQRAPLELARQRRVEHREHLARLPALEAGSVSRSGVAVGAEAEVKAASAELENLRGERDSAALAADAAAQRVRDLGSEHAALAAVTVPAGVDHLDERRQQASADLEQAAKVLHEAERSESEARTARQAAVAQPPLEQALRDLGDLRGVSSELASAQGNRDRARQQRESADAVLAAAELSRQQCQQAAEDARRAHVAADLRPHLTPGEPCPVCDQTVHALPAPLHAAAISETQLRLDEAAAAVTAAQREVRTAATGEAAATAVLDSLTGQQSRRVSSLSTALAGPLAGASLTATASFVHRAGQGQDGEVAEALAEVGAGLQARRRLDETADTAATAAEAARAQTRAAQAALTKAEAGITAAGAALRAARDPLVALGAPPADGTALAAAWASLASWAAGQAQARETGLAAARAAATASTREQEQASVRFGQAEAALSQLRAAATKAAKADQEARTRLTELTGRIAELARLTDDSPDEEQIAAQLAQRDQLETAASVADQQLIAARGGRSAAERALAARLRAESAARGQLSAARDQVVRLGAPALPDTGLLAAWTALADWAASAASAREQELVPARQRVTAAQARVHQLTAELSADLAQAGIRLQPGEATAAAPPAVAMALERARSQTVRIAERREQAAGLITRRDAAQDEQQVAKLLGDLLRSDRFPRWLVTAATDALVADASTKLAELSGGQFDLTHEDGDFYVIDHTDADSRRSVRTLSGGETFQASLALALALSAQMSGLASAGAARLDSIFLDEGFGTLDPETLEVVAATLETLAQGQRMVGVITHVAALAEQVPVRFLVSRDARTSHVVRESLTASGGDA